MDPVTQLVLAEDETTRWSEDGFIVLRGITSSQYARAMWQEVDEIVSIMRPSLPRFFQTAQYLRDSDIDAFVNSAALRSIASQLLGGQSSLLYSFLAAKEPLAGPWGLHQDEYYITTRQGDMINFWMALDQTTPENGALLMAPGTHNSGLLESIDANVASERYSFDVLNVARQPEQLDSITLDAGDMVAFTGRTVHGSHANRTAEPRYGYGTIFVRDGVEIKIGEQGKWKDPLTDSPYDPTPVDRIDPNGP